jgi:hypothetical protein
LALATGVATSPLMRIWGGKYTPQDARPEYRPVAKKIGVGALGFIAEEVHPTKSKRYMAKSGIPQDQDKVSVTLSSRRESHYRSYLAIVKELIAAQLYTLLGHGAFYVPKHRLHRMDIINEQTKDNALAVALMKEVNLGRPATEQITQGLHLLARWIEGYQDLAKLTTCYLDADDQEPTSFQTLVEAGRVPEYAHIEGKRLPILGLMEIMAASRLLGDTDVLGGGAMNAGFVVERKNGQPVAIRVMKIDAGEAFSWSAEHNQFAQFFSPLSEAKKLADPKDLQFGNMQPKVILWGKLLESQKQRFLHTLKQGYAAFQDEPLIDFILHRRGAFDEATPGRTLLPAEMVADFKKAWRTYMKYQTLPQVYGAELAGFPAAEMGASAVPFNPKAVGAASCTLEEALALSRTP